MALVGALKPATIDAAGIRLFDQSPSILFTLLHPQVQEAAEHIKILRRAPLEITPHTTNIPLGNRRGKKTPPIVSVDTATKTGRLAAEMASVISAPMAGADARIA